MGIGAISIGVGLGLLSVIPAAEALTVEFVDAGFTRQVETTSAQKLDLDWPAILRLYAGLESEALWHDGEVLNARGRRLYAWLADAAADGLNPADYHVMRLELLRDASFPGARVERELLLSDGYLRLASDLRQGNLPARMRDPSWRSVTAAFDPVAALLEAIASASFGALLDSLGPQNHEYARLREALAQYRLIEKAGGWSRLESGHSLRPGDRDPLIARLRLRLAMELDWKWQSVGDDNRYDADLVTAVERFQSRHGLEPDGVVGPETLAALNVPVSQRIAQLRTNLERWRWLPHRLASDHILVNTAGFQFSLHSNQRVVFSGRTVNGRVARQTPAMVTRITHLVANPPWTVPRSIAVKDVLPRQQQDPSYLSRKRMHVYQDVDGVLKEVDPGTIDWSLHHADNFPFTLRQESGSGSSLGRVKFYMPNQQAIFLHDTPAVGLFKRSSRAYSSGCVRVEGAERLAYLLAARAGSGEAERFSHAMETGETLWIALTEPLAVYLTYFTSWVDEAGLVQFRPDIYSRDTDLMLALGSENNPLTAQREAGFRPASL